MTALAMVNAAKQKGLQLLPLDSPEETPGKGIIATIQGKIILAGRRNQCVR